MVGSNAFFGLGGKAGAGVGGGTTAGGNGNLTIGSNGNLTLLAGGINSNSNLDTSSVWMLPYARSSQPTSFRFTAPGGVLRTARPISDGGSGYSHDLYSNGGRIQILAAMTNIFNVVSSQTFTIDTSGLTIDTNGFSSLLSLALTGVGVFTKDGAGTLTLNKANSHNGGLTINGGTLHCAVAGCLGTTGTITVNAGAVLTLNGLYTVGGLGARLVNNGGTVNP